MPLLSVQEVSLELSVPITVIEELIRKNLITPYGGRARLGEPRFSRRSLTQIQEQVSLIAAQ